ncbi:uncharacterized protein LOC130283841 [Hyla sarda]|uniref:uncharacterized protein LOC130283841 n=1 Tax=Hyla sarda TaxID=327740 RepID=UPI0024C3D7C8|nr:uncharacterized protein LOC130283841 [Hyla sarda]
MRTIIVALLVVVIHMAEGSALEVTVSPSQVGIVHSDVILSCTFKVDKPPINPQFLATFWHFGEKEIARHDSKATWSAPEYTMNEQTITQGDASLTIRNVTVSHQGAYKCTVVYSPNSQVQEIQLDILAVPEVQIQKKAILSGVTSLLQCSVTNFFPKDMKVTWLKNGQTLSGLAAQDDRTNVDNTFTRISSVNVTFLEEQGKPKITCQVEHKYLQEPIKDFYIVQYGAAPTVNMKASKTTDGNDQIYMCEATNYFPKEVTMDWLLDGKRIDSTLSNNNGYFNKEIFYRIQNEGNNPPSQISCEVQHETLNSPVTTTKEVKVERACKRSCHFGIIGVLIALLISALPALWYYMKRESQKFLVSHIHSLESEEKVAVYCMASNCPEDVRVTWTITENGTDIEISENKLEKDEEAGLLNNQVSQDYTVETDRSQSDKLHHAISTLTFTPAEMKHKEIKVSCTFLCNGTSQQKHLLWKFTEIRRPEVPDPMQLSLGDNGDVVCSVSLQNFFPKDVKIKWSHGLGQFQDAETLKETFTKNSACSFNVRSECRVPGNLLKDQGYRIRATWSLGNETGQQEASITDSGWRPVMGEIEKPTFMDGKEAKLLCRVSGYFPDVLDVKWLRRDAGSQEDYVVSDSDKYKIPIVEATQQEDKTFTCTACLNLSVSAATDFGAEFICRVRHPSIPTHVEKSTGAIRVIGIRAVNVNLNEDKMRAEVLLFPPNDVKITWGRQKGTKKDYEEYKDVSLNKYPSSDGTYTCYSEIPVSFHKDRKYYRVVVKHDASSTVIEKIILRENGEFYLFENEKMKTLLAQMSEQQQGKSINAESQEPPAGIKAVNVTLLNKAKIRAEVSHFTPKDIEITWRREKTKTKMYEDCAHSLTVEVNSDDTYTAYSEITLKDKSKRYEVVVDHKASKSSIKRTVLQEHGKWYIIDKKNVKTPLAQTSEQQNG